MIGLLPHLRARVELAVVGWCGHCSKIPSAHVNAYDLCCAGRRWIKDFYRKRDEQIEAFSGLIIPEFGPANGRAFVKKGDVFVIALIGQNEPSLQSQDTDLLAGFEGVVALVVVVQGWGNIAGCLIQTLKPLFGVALRPRVLIFVPLRPQPFVGGSNLAGDIAGHLCGQTELRAHIGIRFLLEADTIARFAVRKRVGADMIQRVPIGQLRLAQKPELVRRGGQLQFGGQFLFHQE